MGTADPHGGKTAIDDLVPDDPLMAAAWAGCLRWAVTRPDILDAFRRDTGIALTAARSPIDRMVDGASGRDAEVARAFLAWFNANVWGDLNLEAGEATPEGLERKR